jgi:hypothetical protein
MQVQDWAELTSTAVADSLANVIRYIPNVLGALVVVLVGVIVAWAVKTVIVRGFGYIKLKKYTDAVGLGRIFTEKVEVVDLVGDIAKWTVVIVFLIPALEILNLSEMTSVVEGLVAYIPNVVVAIVSVVVGAAVADLASRIVRSTAVTIGAKTADMAADLTKWVIVIFVVLGALQQLGILTELIGTLTVGVVAFFVISGGIAFGLGGKEVAADMLKRATKNMPKK